MSSTALPRPATRGLGTTLRQRLRRVAEAAVTPLDPADVLDVFHPLRRGAELRGRIVEVRSETSESATIVLKPGRDWQGHLPGQYVRVGVDVDGVRLWRTYSLTHGPRPDRCLSITVKAIADGVVSNYLVHRARPGQMLQLDQAQGEFVLPQPMPEKLLLVTAGSGITPVIGMLRNLFSRATPVTPDIVLLHSALTRDSVIFGPELRGYAARGLIRLVELHTDVDGLLDVADLEKIVPDLDERTSYACGPVGLLDALEEHHTVPRADAPGGAVPYPHRRARRGWHPHLRRRPHRRRRRRHPDPRRRRRRRRAHAQRVPDGHLHELRAPAQGRRRARPAQRRDHHRRSRRDRARRRPDPDLHQRGRRAVPPSPTDH